MDDGRQNRGGGTVRGRGDDNPLVGAFETLVALEQRIEAIEDLMTSGDALPLPPPPKSRLRERGEASLEALEAALLVGTMTRRMNLRLGAIERALQYRAPLGLESGIQLRSTRRMKALQAGSADGAKERAALRRAVRDPNSRTN